MDRPTAPPPDAGERLDAAPPAPAEAPPVPLWRSEGFAEDLDGQACRPAASALSAPTG